MFGLLYGRKTFTLSVTQIVAAILSVALNVLFIKFWGLVGAFSAVLIVNLSQCVLTYYLAQPHYKVVYEWRKIATMASSALVLFGLINAINVQNLGFVSMVEKAISYVPHGTLGLLGSGLIGKMLGILHEKATYIFEGLLKGFLSLTFIFVLTHTGIIPKGIISKFVIGFIPVKIANLLPNRMKMEARLVDTARTP